MRQNGGSQVTPESVRALLAQRSQSGEGDGESSDQSQQNGKESFLAKARAGQTDDYLKSTRTAPLSRYEIKAGWEIPAVLEQALNSDLPGELKALVSSNVYDTASGRYLLIPQGSRLVGVYNSRIGYGQDGVQVIWDRVIYPDGSSLDLSGMIGQDAHGFSGFRDKVDRHYTRLIGFAVLTSLFAAASEISQNQNRSLLTYPSPAQVAGSAVGQQASDLGAQMTCTPFSARSEILIRTKKGRRDGTEEKAQRRADCRRGEAIGGGPDGGRDGAGDRRQHVHDLLLEGEVRRPGAERSDQAAAPGRRERPAEEAGGGTGLDQEMLKALSNKKRTELVDRRADAAYLIETFAATQRKACELAHIARSSYRYRAEHGEGQRS